MLRAVGKHDRRNSMKMKRRKAQVKKKTRLKRQSKERKAAPTGAQEGRAAEEGSGPRVDVRSPDHPDGHRSAAT